MSSPEISVSKHTPAYQTRINELTEQAELLASSNGMIEVSDSYDWTPISNVIGGEDHKERVSIVLADIANTISRTFGPGGELTFIYDPQLGNHVSTKDGYSVLRRLSYVDELSNLVLDTVRSASKRVAKNAGDGSSTAVIMANYIHKALREVEHSIPSSAIHAVLDSLAEVIQLKLKESAIRVEHDSPLLDKIASIAANNNTEVGSTIANLFKASPDTSVLVERGTGEEDEIIHRENFRVYTPLIDSIFTNTNNANQVEIEKCALSNAVMFITDVNVSLTMLNTVIMEHMNAVFQQGKAFVLVASDFTPEVTDALFQFKRQNPTAPFLMMMHSIASTDSRNRLNDLAVYTNGRVIPESYLDIESDNYDSVSSIDLSPMFGYAEKIVASDSITLVESATRRDDFSEYVEEIKNQIKIINRKDTNEQQGEVVEKLEKRLSELANRAVVINVGGRTETERERKFYAYEDAVVACQSAISAGITHGGAGGLGVYKYLSNNTAEVTSMAFKIFKTKSALPVDEGTVGIFLAKLCQAYRHCLELVYTNMKLDKNYIDVILQKCVQNDMEYDIIQCKFFNSGDVPTVVTPIKTDIEVLTGCISIAYTLLCSNQTVITAPHLNDTITKR